MNKRIIALLCIILCFVLIFSISVSAKQIEIAPDNAIVQDGAVGAESPASNGAEVPASNGAEVPASNGAESPADTGAGNKFNFDANSSGWKNFDTIFCHLWEYGSDAYYSWQGKAEKCTKNADGTWSYDLDKAKISLDSSKQYCLIFSNNNGMQTYDLLCSSACIGDTAYCDGTTYENPTDSTKTAQAAFWKNQDKTKLGPLLAISSIGTVVGTCCPTSTTPYKMFVGFLQNTLENARTFSKKDDQTLIDDIGLQLLLTKKDVKNAIKVSGVDVDWHSSSSSLPGRDIDFEDRSLILDFEFQNNTSILELEIPSNVNSIGEGAFYGCSNLKSLKVYFGVKTINKGAFYDCKALKSASIPSSVVSIGEKALGYYRDFISSDILKVDGFTIYGKKGSSAEKYAKNNGFKFIESSDLVLPEYILGDSDMNEYLNIVDVTTIQLSLANLIPDQSVNKKAADVNADGMMNIYDATYLQMFFAKLSNIDGSYPYNVGYSKNPKV